MSKTVMLDAGHGGYDPGAVNGNRHEADDNLRLALTVRPLLQAQGVTVLMTRTTDTYIAINTRAKMATDAGVDLFVSLHRNSWTGSGANGVENYVQTNAGSSAVNAATAVLERIAAVGIQSNRGVKRSSAYGVLNGATMPAMLLELGFISNTQDNTLFDQYFDAYAAAIAQGICAWLGVSWKEQGGGAAIDLLYRVQVGAFAVYANAEDYVAEVKKLELDAFMVEVEDRRLYRVQVGAFRNKANAENYIKEVKAKGLDAFIVAV